MAQPIEITTLYSRCSLCQVAIQSTKGDSPETRLESLLSNLYGHIKKKHTEEGSEIGLRLAAIQQQATTVVLAEYLELHRSTSGEFTDEFINEHCEELANNLCELLGIEDADPEDGEDDEEEEEEDAEVIGEDGEEIDTGVRPVDVDLVVTDPTFYRTGPINSAVAIDPEVVDDYEEERMRGIDPSYHRS